MTREQIKRARMRYTNELVTAMMTYGDMTAGQLCKNLECMIALKKKLKKLEDDIFTKEKEDK